ncbi:helix-turn-helix transcriptional regulator [Alkalihalobacillus sp. BA299]|uniref:helix-turn-helix domain-containing protein n=1 Tax=Alkalihalobacillus sp. BA299 TaxID=2815938 RepID=UPI001ADAFE3E|nr:helix-turn-helix transcriptional regulator [Alkalihalobacillus sp. BA299]
MDVGKKIRFFRKEKNISQSDLANNICSVSYLSKIENGKVTANTEIIEKLFERLQINVVNLVDPQKLLSILRNWNRSIANNKKQAATRTFKSLNKIMDKITTPYHIIKFKIFKLHYLVNIDDLKEAKRQLRELNQYKEFLDEELKFFFYKFKGFYFYRINDKKGAMDNYSIALEYIGSASLQEWEKGYFYYLISYVSHELRIDQAVIYFLAKALEIYKKLNNTYMVVHCKFLEGLVYQRIGMIEEAKESTLFVLKYGKDSNNVDLLYRANEKMGVLYSNQGDSREAIQYFEKNVKITENIPVSSRLKTICYLVDEYKKLNAPLQSLYWLEIGNELIKENKEQDEYEFHLKTYGFLLLEKTNTDEYKLYIRDKALPYFKKRNQWENVAHYANLLANYYQRQIKYKKAAQYFETSYQAIQKLIPNFKGFPAELEHNIQTISEKSKIDYKILKEK